MIEVGRSTWAEMFAVCQEMGLECWMLMVSTNFEIEAAPNSCDFSKDTVRKIEEGCALTEDKTKATATRTKSRSGMVPKAMCWLSFQAQFAGNMPADGLEVGQLHSWALQTPGSHQGLNQGL